MGQLLGLIEGKDAVGRMRGAVIIPGSSKDQSAYRSELAGLYSIMVAIKKICEFFNLREGSIELGCDGQSAIDKAFNYVSLIRIEDADYVYFTPCGTCGHTHLQSGPSDTCGGIRMIKPQ